MFTILISIPKSSRHSNPNEVSWELVHSYFSDLFSEDFVCVIKPYNGDHTKAKLFFSKEVTFARSSDSFLINNTVPAKVLERVKEPNLHGNTSGTVKLPRSFNEAELAPIKVDLDEQYHAELQLTTPTLATLQACHPEVLSSAQSALRSWATVQVSASPAATVGASGGATSGHRNRRPLFPDAIDDDTDAAGAAAPLDTEYLRHLGPYDFELALNNQCCLRVEPRDITTLPCDVLVVTTSCALSLNFGLARVVAAKSGQQQLHRLCQQAIQGQSLKFGESRLVASPVGSQLPARHLLFLALPNDQRLEATIDSNQFKDVMKNIVKALLDSLVRLSLDNAVRTVAMTPIGVTLPYWTDRAVDFAHVLAEAFYNARQQTGELQRIHVCDVSLESLATLGEVLEARFGVQLARALPSRNRAFPVEGRRFELRSQTRGAAVAAESSDDEDESEPGDCELCCQPFTRKNRRTKFHCDRGQLCAQCVRRLQDPRSPGNGLCPACMTRYRPAVGSQPDGGTMTVTTQASSLPGHEGSATLVVTYTFGPGVQGAEHPSPGRPYRGVSRVTYFPDSPEGRSVVDRLKVAFQGRAVFTIGTSATTGMENTITWATVHHKTRIDGGAEGHGYPDPNFLTRISAELRDLGY